MRRDFLRGDFSWYTDQAGTLQRIIQAGHAEQTITKSRFVAVADYCADERSAALMLRGLASQHQGANHLAYALRIKTAQGIVQRFHDAGEPSGTAGKPVLQLIEGRDLINVCVGVIRYYGGVNLGTGGLARAYGGTARMALDAAKTAPFVEMKQIEMLIDYKQLDYLARELGKLGGEIVDKVFAEQVKVTVVAPAAQIEGISKKFSIR